MSRRGIAAVAGAALVMVGLLVTAVVLSSSADVAGKPTDRPTPPTTTTTTSAPPATTKASTNAAPSTSTTKKAPPAGAAAPAVSNCATPAFSTSEDDDGWNTGDYYVHNNMWNAADYSVSQQLAACSAGNWSVTTTADDKQHDGAVKTYPNVHKDYHDWGTDK